MKIIKIVLLSFAFIVMAALLFIGIIIGKFFFRSSMEINSWGVHTLSIANWLENEDFETSNRNEIEECIKVLNSIQLEYVDDETPYLSQSPTAWVRIYNKKGNEIYTIYFYGELIEYKGRFFTGGSYLMDKSEYDKLRELYRKYGDDDSNN